MQNIAKNQQKHVVKLSNDTISKIAAGEVVQSPAAAIKELMENSLDAKSSTITVTVQDGGLKMFSITDNGCGIQLVDLPEVCHRHTTSKIKDEKDLEQVQTFGFRGEALASISHVGHVTITSRTADQPCSFKMSFKDGEPLEKQPKATAGNIGTTILVEDLFYNLPTRRKNFTNLPEEYRRIADVVRHYAVHKNVGFTCKKYREPLADVVTLGSDTVPEKIQKLYGEKYAKSLAVLSAEKPNLSLTVSGYVSTGHIPDKTHFILFINHRLVQSSALKRTLKKEYETIAETKAHFFVYLDIQVPPQHVDVNISPTKHEVMLLNEERIFQVIREKLHGVLVENEASQKLTQQSMKAFVQKSPHKLSGQSPQSDHPRDNNHAAASAMTTGGFASSLAATTTTAGPAQGPHHQQQTGKSAGLAQQTITASYSNNYRKMQQSNGQQQKNQAQDSLGRRLDDDQQGDQQLGGGGQKTLLFSDGRSSTVPDPFDDDFADFGNSLSAKGAVAATSGKQGQQTKGPAKRTTTQTQPANKGVDTSEKSRGTKKIKFESELTSVSNLMTRIRTDCNSDLQLALYEHHLIGLDGPSTLLIQHKNHLFSLNYEKLT